MLERKATHPHLLPKRAGPNPPLNGAPVSIFLWAAHEYSAASFFFHLQCRIYASIIIIRYGPIHSVPRQPLETEAHKKRLSDYFGLLALLAANSFALALYIQIAKLDRARATL